MGGGSYSTVTASARTTLRADYSFDQAQEQLFTKKADDSMIPNGFRRESRDSDEHPESIAIIIALDLTGSMGEIPARLVKGAMAKIVETIIQAGIEHPQILFMGVGDDQCDKFPIQVGQFESSDELMDHWLTKLYLEKGGGGNYGESYALAWAFAGMQTDIDCLEKRGQKGFLFTIGDEACLKQISEKSMRMITGDGQAGMISASEALSRAQEKYNVKHIFIEHGLRSFDGMEKENWTELLGQDTIVINDHSQVAKLIGETVVSMLPTGKNTATTKQTSTNNPEQSEVPTTPDTGEIML